MRIFDTFLFAGAFDLLDLRLRTLDKLADIFVIVEANKTFRGKAKPFEFERRRDDYAELADRIRYVKVTDGPAEGEMDWRGTEEAKRRAAVLDHQRNCVMRGLLDADDQDVILLADLDEIPDPRVLGHVLSALREQSFVTMRLRMYAFWLNARLDNWTSGIWTTADRLRREKRTLAEIFRQCRMKPTGPLVHGGWHFTWLGPLPRIEAKLSVIMESKWDTDAHRERLRTAYANDEYPFGPTNRKLVIEPIDDTFPLPLRQNGARWASTIKRAQ